MKKRSTAIVVGALVALALVYRLVFAAQPEPSVGLYWTSSVDPTVGAGVCAPQWQLLFRTDNDSIYVKTGTTCTGWTPFSASASSSLTGTLTATKIPVAAGASTLGNSNLINTGGALTDTTDTTVNFSSAKCQLGGESIAILSPASISGTVNNWTPTNWTTGTFGIVEVALTNTTTLNGLAALATGTIATLCNTSASFDLTIAEEAAASTAANRFSLGGNGSNTIILVHHTGPEIQCANFYYGAAISRWVLRGSNAGTIPALSVQSGFNVLSSGATIAGGISTSASGSGLTVNGQTISATNTSTYDTTAGALQSTAINGSATSTRSAGANNLTNVGGQFTASGAQVNDALVTLAGDVLLNQSSGSTTIGGALSMASHQIHNVTDPTSAQDAATQNYVQAEVNTVLQSAGTSASATPGTNIATITAAATHSIVNWTVYAAQAAVASTQYTITVTYSDTTTTSVSSGAGNTDVMYGNPAGILLIRAGGFQSLTNTTAGKAVTSVSVVTAGTGVGTRAATVAGMQI